MVGGTTRLGSREVLLALGFAVLMAAVLAGRQTQSVAVLVALFAIMVVAHRTLFSWQSLLGLIVAVVWFVPIKFYRLPANLPFHLELYRIVVAFVLAGWGASLLVDSRVRVRRTPLDAPILLIVASVFLSELTNPSRVSGLGAEVAKSMTFFLGYLLLFYFVASVLSDRASLEFALRIMTASATVVGASAVIERRTNYNVFYHLQSIIPFLHFLGGTSALRVGTGRLRVLASAQHPIALGAALAVMVPVAVYLAQTSSRRWWLATGILLLGIMGTASRTAIVMLVVTLLVYLWLKGEETRRMWPALIPALVVVHVALPGALGTIKNAFFPAGGLIAQQTQLPPNANPLLAGGRIRLIRPSIDEVSQRPLFGYGWGTRITGFDNPNRNAPILDDQWLGTLIEIGVVGFGGFVWLVIRAVRRLAAAARRGPPEQTWLFTALAAAIASFAVGMLTYDTFAFIQATFVFWILLAVAASFLAAEERSRNDVHEHATAA